MGLFHQSLFHPKGGGIYQGTSGRTLKKGGSGRTYLRGTMKRAHVNRRQREHGKQASDINDTRPGNKDDAEDCTTKGWREV
jgi:hypothetical protein